MSLQKILKIDLKEEDSEFENRDDELNFKKLNEVLEFFFIIYNQ